MFWITQVHRGINVSGPGNTPGGHLCFRLDIILVKGLSKYTLNTYFSGTKIDPKYALLHEFFLICPSCPFQNWSIWPKTQFFFSNFARVCTPKHCTRVHWAVSSYSFLSVYYVLLCNHDYIHCLNHRQAKYYITRRNETERKL